MSIFCIKKITPAERLGCKLKAAREAQGLSLEQLNNVTRIGLNYLLEIESGNYKKLPKAAAFPMVIVQLTLKTSFLYIFNLNISTKRTQSAYSSCSPLGAASFDHGLELFDA